jgi:hypothetical protein
MILEPGRHLFIDDSLVAQAEGLTHTLHPPKKLGRPILKGMGSEDNNYQPYATVLYDSERRRFRMWYGTKRGPDAGVFVSYVESNDGIEWEKPYKELFEIHGFGSCVTDEGPDPPDPARRYKMIYWEKGSGDKHYLKDGRAGIGVAFSPDGIVWTKHQPHPVLPDLWQHSPKGDPAGKGSIKWRDYAADIVHSTWDPVRKIHVAYVKTWTWPPDEMGYQSPTGDGMGRRLSSLITSPDFVHWSTPVRCFVPEPDDFASIEFYACRPKPRANQMLNFTCILNEEGRTEEGRGFGYTVLSTSNDLVHWRRMKQPWLDRSGDNPKASDHAVAWVADVVTVGDEEYIYYGGYSSGHKNFTDRTINLARLRKDGFVSRDAGEKPGRLLTPPLRMKGDRLTVNAKVRGELRLRILDLDGNPVPGFGDAQIAPITGDSTAHPVKSDGDFAQLKGRPIRLELTLRDAQLYQFELH